MNEVKMTNQEAQISVLSYCADICGKIDSCKCEDTECVEAVIIKALEKADKYQWHDIIKDPDDLPQDYSKVIIYARRYSGVVDDWVEDYWTVSYSGEYGFDVATGEYGTKVIAWKYIEPFK